MSIYMYINIFFYIYADTSTYISWLHGFLTALSSIFQLCPLYYMRTEIFSFSADFSNAFPRNLATRLWKLTKLHQCLSMIYADTPLSFVNRYVVFITNLWTAKRDIQGQICCRERRKAELWVQLIGKGRIYIHFLVKIWINTMRWVTINILVMWWKLFCRMRKWICMDIHAAWGDWKLLTVLQHVLKFPLCNKYLCK